MTTRILIVNHGPKSVEVKTTHGMTQVLFPGNEQSEFVFEGQMVEIKEMEEKKEDDPK